MIDRLLAIVAMLVAVRPLVRGVMGSGGRISLRRLALLVGGGLCAVVASVGLLAVKVLLLGDDGLDARTFLVPSWYGGTLAFFGGMLGTSTLLAPRGPEGMSEDDAIRYATQAVAMWTYLGAPRVTLVALGVVRLSRGAVPWASTRVRWPRVVEGALLVAFVFVTRDPLLGGLLTEVTR